MAAGIVDHETGTRDMRRLGGLRHAMPITATLAIVASAAMAGVPLLNGFLSKEMFFAEAAEYYDGSLLDRSMPWIALVCEHPRRSPTRCASSTASSSGRSRRDLPKTPHEPPFLMRLPVEVLVVVCLAVGIVPALTIGPYLQHRRRRGARAAHPRLQPRGLARGQHAAGHEPRRARRRRRALRAALGRRSPAAPRGRRCSARSRASASSSACSSPSPGSGRARLFRLLGTERLQPQLRILVLVALGAAAWMLWGAERLRPGAPPGFDPLFAMLWAVGGACAVAAAWQAKYHRFAALVLVGGAGLVTCLTFVWLSAPDLAVTQLLVEIVTTVLLLLGLRWLPKRLEEIAARPDRSPPASRRGRDLVIAVACGLGIAGVAYAVMTTPLDRGVADLVPRARLRRGRRHQRRQRHPRRLPRLRHLRRDHRARHRRAHASSRCCAASARRRRASACPSSSASRTRSTTSARTAASATRCATTWRCPR